MKRVLRKSNRKKMKNKFLKDYIIKKNTKHDKSLNKSATNNKSKNKPLYNNKNKYRKEDGKEYEVAAILDKEIVDGEEYYFVKFKGFTNSYNLWLPKRNLNCNELIYQFERTQIQKRRGI